MSSNKTRNIAGGGAWLMALALTFVSSAWPEAIRPHPYWVAALFVLGLILFIFPFLQKLLTAHTAESHPPINITVSPNISPTFNNAPNITQEASPVQTNTLTSPSATPAASPSNLVLIPRPYWTEIFFNMVPGAWQKAGQFDYDKQPKNGLLLEIKRPHPAKGAGRFPPLVVVPILTFTHNRFPAAETVKRAYWLGRTNYEMAFDAGSTESLVIGLLEPPLFASYECPFDQHGGHPDFDLPVRDKGPRKTIPAFGTIYVQLLFLMNKLGRPWKKFN